SVTSLVSTAMNEEACAAVEMGNHFEIEFEQSSRRLNEGNTLPEFLVVRHEPADVQSWRKRASGNVLLPVGLEVVVVADEVVFGARAGPPAAASGPGVHRESLGSHGAFQMFSQNRVRQSIDLSIHNQSLVYSLC